MLNQAKNLKDRQISIFIFIAAFFTRFIGIKNNSITGDESFSYFITNNSYSRILEATSNDVHPPLYYFLTKGWMYFIGTSEFSLRLLSILLGSLAILAGYFLIRLFFDKAKSLLISLAIMFNPFLIYYSWEIRMYSLSLLLILSSTYFLMRIQRTLLKKYNKTLLIELIVLYSLSIGLALYTHYFAFLVFFSQLIYIFKIYFEERKINSKILLSLIVIPLIIFLPWLYTMTSQLARGQGLDWLPRSNFFTLSNSIFDYLSTFSMVGLLSIAIMPFVAVFIFFIFKNYKKEYLLFYLIAFIPLLTVVAISFFRPIFHVRYLIYSSYFLTLIFLIAYFNSKAKHKNYLLVLLLGLFLLGNIKLYLKPQKEYGQIRSYIQSENNDYKIFALEGSFTYLPVKYYFNNSEVLTGIIKLNQEERFGKILYDEYKYEYVKDLKKGYYWLVLRKEDKNLIVSNDNVKVINSKNFTSKTVLLIEK
jgi:uncharacterized membrane protein